MVRAGFQLDTQRVDHTDIGWCALKHGVDQAGVELRFGQYAIDALILYPALNFSDTRRAWVRCVPNRDRAGCGKVEGIFKVLIGIVENDEPASVDGFKSRRKLGRQFRQLFARGCCVCEICAGIVGIGRRKLSRDLVQPDACIFRGQPRVRVMVPMCVIMMINVIRVVLVIVMFRMIVVVMFVMIRVIVMICVIVMIMVVVFRMVFVVMILMLCMVIMIVIIMLRVIFIMVMIIVIVVVGMIIVVGMILAVVMLIVIIVIVSVIMGFKQRVFAEIQKNRSVRFKQGRDRCIACQGANSVLQPRGQIFANPKDKVCVLQRGGLRGAQVVFMR